MQTVFLGVSPLEHGGGVELGPARWTSPVAGSSWVAQLQGEGWQTLAVVSNPHLAKGFDRGFDAFWHGDQAREPLVLLHNLRQWRWRVWGNLGRLQQEADDRAVALALERIAAARGPTLLWVHLMGPHEYQRDPLLDEGAPIEAQYAARVARAGALVARLVEAAPSWATILTSDHGEAFGEDGAVGHGTELHDAQLRVPLAWRGPGVAPGVDPRQVALQDLGAMALALARGGGEAWPLRSRVLVGGVRNRPTAAASRGPEGLYEAVGAGVIGPPAPDPDALERAALRALGYLDDAP